MIQMKNGCERFTIITGIWWLPACGCHLDLMGTKNYSDRPRPMGGKRAAAAVW